MNKKSIISKIINIKRKEINFFDYPADIQKQLVKYAAKNANEMQLALVKEYEQKFPSKRK